MRYIKNIIVLLFLFASINAVAQKSTFTIADFETWLTTINKGNSEEYLKKIGFEFKKNAAEAIVYSNLRHENIFLYYENSKLIRVGVEPSLDKWFEVVQTFKDHHYKLEATFSDKVNDFDYHIEKWTKDNYIIFSRPSKSFFEISYADASVAVKPADNSTKAKRSVRFSSIQDVATQMNGLMNSARLMEKYPNDGKSRQIATYDFTLLGKTDFKQPSIEFFGKDDEMYVQMYVPAGADCPELLSRFKLTDCGRAMGDDIFGFMFSTALMTCNSKNYQNLHCNFKKLDEDMQADLYTWLPQHY